MSRTATRPRPAATSRGGADHRIAALAAHLVEHLPPAGRTARAGGRSRRLPRRAAGHAAREPAAGRGGAQRRGGAPPGGRPVRVAAVRPRPRAPRARRAAAGACAPRARRVGRTPRGACLARRTVARHGAGGAAAGAGAADPLPRAAGRGPDAARGRGADRPARPPHQPGGRRLRPRGRGERGGGVCEPGRDRGRLAAGCRRPAAGRAVRRRDRIAARLRPHVPGQPATGRPRHPAAGQRVPAAGGLGQPRGSRPGGPLRRARRRPRPARAGRPG